MARILLVEDDENLRDLVEEWLVFEKYTVVACASGLEAVEQLSMLDFDCVMLDRHLTDINGIEILTRLRAEGKTVPVIMLTGSNSAAERKQGLEAGASAYISKPFKLNELSGELARLVAAYTSKERN